MNSTKKYSGSTVLFQLTFTFIYSTFSKKIQFQQNKRISNKNDVNPNPSLPPIPLSKNENLSYYSP